MKLTKDKQKILDKFLELVKEFPCTIKTDLWVIIAGKPHTIGGSTLKESTKFLKKDYHSATVVKSKVKEIIAMHPELWTFTEKEYRWAYDWMYKEFFRDEILKQI